MTRKNLPAETAFKVENPNQIVEHEDKTHEDFFEGLLFSEGETDNYYFISRVNGRLMRSNLEVEKDEDGEIEVSKVTGHFEPTERFNRKFRKLLETL